MTKTAELVRDLLDEYITKRKEKVDEEASNSSKRIFVYGFISGLLVNYTGIWSFTVGLTVGVCLTKCFSNNVVTNNPLHASQTGISAVPTLNLSTLQNKLYNYFS